MTLYLQDTAALIFTAAQVAEIKPGLLLSKIRDYNNLNKRMLRRLPVCSRLRHRHPLASDCRLQCCWLLRRWLLDCSVLCCLPSAGDLQCLLLIVMVVPGPLGRWPLLLGYSCNRIGNRFGFFFALVVTRCARQFLNTRLQKH